jgi:nuclear pore complex protein Nup210
LRESSNMLAISLRDASGMKNAEDFVKLSVRGIFNKNLLVTTGDIVCFESPLSDGFPWHSFNSEALQLHGSVGRVLATAGTQKVSVHHGQPLGIFVNFELSLLHPDKIEFDKTFDIFNGETYRGFFTVSNHQQVNKRGNLITACEDLQENFPIDFVACKLTSHEDAAVLKKFETSPVFDASIGSYACEITALASLEEITSISRSKTINFHLEARLASGIADKIDLKLTPAVQIFPRVLNIDKLYQQEITITGMENILQKVEVTSSHPEHLVLVPMQKNAGRLQFKPKLHNAAAVDSELFVKISSPLTHQSVQIPIAPVSQAEMLSKEGSLFVDLMTNFGKITAVVVIVLTSIAFAMICLKNRDLDTSGGK